MSTFYADDQKRFQDALDSNKHLRDWHDATLNRMNSESDIVVATLGATLIDEQLTDAIKSRFLVDDNFSDGVFDHKYGVSYAGKVKLAYALGLLSRGSADDLDHIGWIRNRFAHKLVLSTPGSGAPSLISFTSDQIVKKCNLLLTPEILKGCAGDDPTEPKGKFIFTVSMIATTLGIQKIGLPKTGSRYDR